LPKAWLPQVRDEINSLLKQNEIEYSESCFKSHALREEAVRRAEGGNRSKRIKYVFHGVSLPSVETLVSSITGHKWMVKMDLKSAYFCIPLSKDCRQYTAINITSLGTFQFTALPMGYLSSSAVFSRLLASYTEVYSMAYLW